MDSAIYPATGVLGRGGRAAVSGGAQMRVGVGIGYCPHATLRASISATRKMAKVGLISKDISDFVGMRAY